MSDFKDEERMDLHSASSFDRTVNCPGWRNLFLSIPKVDFKPDTSPEAERGTRIHKARELMNPLELEDESEVTALESWLGLEREVVRNWLANIAGDENVEWREGERELRIWINNEDTLEPECSARMDVHYIASRALLYIDGKTGAGTGSGKAKDNWQCKVTAVALMFEYSALSVTVALVKPEAFPNGYADVHTWNFDELIDIDKQVRWHIDEARRLDAPRRAGPHCHFCPCKAWCAEGMSMALLPTVVANASVELSKGEIASRVATLGLPDLVYLWQRRGLIKDIQDAVAGRLRGQSEEVLSTYSIKLSPGKDTSYVPAGRIKDLCERLVLEGCVEADVWQCLKPDIAALNELAHKTQRGTKKDAAAWMQSVLGDFKIQQSGEKILREI